MCPSFRGRVCVRVYVYVYVRACVCVCVRVRVCVCASGAPVRRQIWNQRAQSRRTHPSGPPGSEFEVVVGPLGRQTCSPKTERLEKCVYPSRRMAQTNLRTQFVREIRRVTIHQALPEAVQGPSQRARTGDTVNTGPSSSADPTAESTGIPIIEVEDDVQMDGYEIP